MQYICQSVLFLCINAHKQENSDISNSPWLENVNLNLRKQ